jgi:O-succinylbenzoic acid--CoA ligase
VPFLSRTAAARRDAPALFTADETVSFGALDRASEKVARQLVTLGVRSGDVVGVKGHPTPSLISAIHGIWKAQGVLAPMNPRWTPLEGTHALKALRPSLVLVGEGETPPPLFPDVKHRLRLGPEGGGGELELLGSLRPDTGHLPPLSDPAATWDSLPAAHLLTSGTSGVPKVVTLTHGNLRASAEGARERLDLSSSDRWLASLSVAHVGGLALVSRAALVGSGLVLRGSFHAGSFASLVEDGAISHASLVPTMLHQLLDLWGDKPPPETLRCLLIGGAGAEGALVRRALAQGFPLALTYGLTEASSQVSTAPPSLVREKPGTVGTPLSGVELQLAADGEILVRGDTVAGGEVGEEGWLRTGDLARQDEDGHLWVTGRLSHRIISGGINVDPAEVEALLRTHPAVLEVAVVGLPHPRWGEEVVAAVVVRAGSSLPAGELDRLTRAALSSAKRPRVFQLIPALPRNPNGKVDREKVRSLF